MRKESVVLACGAVCALAAASAAAEIPDYLLLDRALRGFQGGVQTDTAFAGYYDGLYGASPSAARNFAAMFFWHASGDIRASLYAPSGQGQGNPPPPRGDGPVEDLTITRFEVTPMSVVLRAEWPLGFPIPFGWIELRGKRDLLEEEWQLVGFVDLDRGQGWAEAEFPFGALMWDDRGDGGAPPMAFFKLVVPDDPDEEWWLADGDEDDDGNPPPPPPPQVPPGSSRSRFALPSWPVSESFPVEPGQTYLLDVSFYTTSHLAAGYGDPIPNHVATWSISAPDGTVLAGSMDVETFLTMASGDDLDDYYTLDARIITIPDARAGGQTIDMNLSVSSEDTILTTEVKGVIKRINLINYTPPAPLQTPPGSTDTGGLAVNAIAPGGTAFITGEPALYLKTDHIDLGGFLPRDQWEFAWRLEIKSERPVYRGTLDDREYPGPIGSGAYTAFSMLELDIGEDLMGGEIVGGKCTLHCRARNTRNGRLEEKRLDFFIRGLNPRDASARAYIDTAMPAFCRPYAWALLQHETKAWAPNGQYFYNQFNPNGSRVFQPNKTGDTKGKNGSTIKQYGWGIGQVDNGAVTNGPNAITTAQVYNWKTNVLTSAAKFTEKRVAYTNMLGRIQEEYPNEWVPPPATTNLHGVTWTHEQWGVTVLYNKSTGVKTTKVKGKDSNGNPIPVDLPCPLCFNPASRTWTFEDNKTNYAQQVSAYLPTNTPPVAVE
ncbi:MAG: hypothetical protein FWG50_11010 [Kiritimatiellaeota bacterium]|nr:hypothetical protein [Kiritimatiellota bacterium]